MSTTMFGTRNAVAEVFGFDDGIPDWLFGQSDNDTIRGLGGADTIWGGGGHDVLDGGMGNDTIRGGTGWDKMTGGAGLDNFEIGRGDSTASYSGADVITDFNSRDDVITFTTNSPAGTASNYVEFTFTGTGSHKNHFEQALAYAQHEDIGGKVQYAFYTDGKDGYLFADLDHNGTVDTGIELPGLNRLSAFSYLDIH